LLGVFLAALGACGCDGDRSTPSSDEDAEPHAPGARPGGDEPGDGERATIRVERAGGQTGMEGSCLLPEVDALSFDADDLAALLAGPHVTTLAERALYSTAPVAGEHGRAVTIAVEAQGEPRIELGCGGVIDQDVELTLSFEQPALDVVVETSVRAFSKAFAVMHAEIDLEVGELLGWPAATPGQEYLLLAVRFEPGGITGTFETGVGYQCGLAVLPAGARCPEWTERQLDPTLEVDSYVPSQVTAAIERFAAVPIAWDDGSTTTLELSVAREPEWACTYQWIETPCPYQLATPLAMRLTTGDGRLDLVLPAKAEVEIAGRLAVGSELCGEAEREGWTEQLSLELGAIVPASVLPAQAEFLRAALPAGSALIVGLNAHARGESMDELRLSFGAIRLGDHAAMVDGVIDATTNGSTLNCYPEQQPIARAALAGSD
jgi:hypothetical protein